MADGRDPKSRTIRAIPKDWLARVFGVLTLTLGIAASPALAQNEGRFEVEVEPGGQSQEETVDGPATPKLGQTFRVGLTNSDMSFDASEIVRIRFETVGDQWNVAEGWRPVKGNDSAPPGWIWMASLQSFDLGDQQLPNVTVVYPNARGLLENEEARIPSVFISGILPPKTEPAAKPARGVADISGSIWPYALALGLICLAAAAGYFLLRRNRRSEGDVGHTAHEAVPQLCAEDWALSEIERRRGMEPCISGESKAIATMASDVMRGYLERRYGIAALEMTTYECMQSLPNVIGERNGTVNGSEDGNVGSFLDECDLVKFAKVPLPSARWQGIWDDAIAIVRRTTPATETTNETVAGTVHFQDPQAERSGLQ